MRPLSLVLLALLPGASAAQEPPDQVLLTTVEFGERFGEAAAVNAEFALVGAPVGETQGAGGSVYAFRRVDGAWVPDGRITPPFSEPHSGFGGALALYGSEAVVAAPYRDVDGHQDAGALYVYRYEGAWVLTDSLVAPTPSTGGEFGSELGLYGDVLSVSALSSVYVFDRSGPTWAFGMIDCCWSRIGPAAGDGFVGIGSTLYRKNRHGEWREDGHLSGMAHGRLEVAQAPDQGNRARFWDPVAHVWSAPLYYPLPFAPAATLIGERTTAAYDVGLLTCDEGPHFAFFEVSPAGWRDGRVLASPPCESDNRAMAAGGGHFILARRFNGELRTWALDAPPAPPPITVTSPAPLDAFLRDAQVHIRWTSTGVTGSVRIQILDADGVVVRTTHSSTDNTGSRNTTLDSATPPGTGYRFRITSLASPAVRGLSAPFSVLHPAFALAVTEPEAGAQVAFGTSGPVTWTSPPGLPASAPVSLYLVRGGDPALRRRLRQTTNDGQGRVTWPSDVPAASDYRVEIVADADARYWGRSAPFALGAYPTLTVLAPAGGASWAAGSQQTVAWGGTGLDPAGVLRLYLVRPGTPRERLARTAAGSATGGSWGWTLPPDLAPGADYRVQAVYEDGAGLRLSAKGEAFAVTAPGLALRAGGDLPGELTLEGARPNPASSSTAVRYGLPVADVARVSVYDALGRAVAVLAEGAHPAGWHEATLSAGSLAPGVYVVRLESTAGVLTRRLTLVR